MLRYFDHCHWQAKPLTETDCKGVVYCLDHCTVSFFYVSPQFCRELFCGLTGTWSRWSMKGVVKSQGILLASLSESNLRHLVTLPYFAKRLCDSSISSILRASLGIWISSYNFQLFWCSSGHWAFDQPIILINFKEVHCYCEQTWGTNGTTTLVSLSIQIYYQSSIVLKLG